MRKICVYTSGRTYYGLLRGVMKEIRAEESNQTASVPHYPLEVSRTKKPAPSTQYPVKLHK